MASLINSAEKIGNSQVKEWYCMPIFYHMQKLFKRVQSKTWNYEAPGKNCMKKKKPLDMVLGKDLLEVTPRAQATRSKISKIKLKNFFTAKETINKIKEQPTKWEKNIFKAYIW